MGKQQKAPKGERRIDNKEAYHRMNFLLQASALMSTSTTAIRPASSSGPAKSSNEDGKNVDLSPLGRFYTHTMKSVGRRLVIRMDPSVKRSICKRCDNTLIPGHTSSVRVESRPRRLNHTCLFCKGEKTLLARPEYTLFTEREEVVVKGSTAAPPSRPGGQ
ncbi:uncharacterized protein VTP21DRAFT_6054 [Calcarisporiella thermophila]|uniref:uncharacterized protein n=1 Tax=Calcarisporiella thermophila TaxID=911321 RepID=UPI0037421515